MSLLTRAIGSYGHFRQVFADTRRKAIGQIAREVADVARRTGSSPEWYFINFAYRREAGDYTQYLNRRQAELLAQKMRERHSADLLVDKVRFHEHFRGVEVSLPRLLASNAGPIFQIDGIERRVDDEADFMALINELLGRSASGSIFAKPIDGTSGYGCRRIDKADGELAELYAQTTAGRYLFEETLVQHPALSAIYPNSINTVRVLTCGEPGEPAAAVAAILRLGMSGSVVDNASQGGIFVGLDLKTGKLFPQAREFFKHGGKVYDKHPDTGFRFEGAQVPGFPGVLATAESAAVHVPLELIGWDIAVTEAGPVIVEGNSSPHLPMMEIALAQGMLAQPCFRTLCQRILGV
ncbi:MAG TPA: sugar-transfer associated ATP-grasp domain-containing protein [Geminicoccus sp.]|jgi:hypothetical protein|uniref:sugar-transfer associated ATP-grasp domain-containing protein n=1 Tax=Geminicoccus sp. TaxID=2024832 RepID=UPI002E339321|nr:sugar-transfer associated ATP-grasp domain-containing protein [Geminicoccus sp.]HEX2524840.1 sugar-transfer associated ATP-grasp domain-containing protein [Geminicoccus sp.]